MKKFILKKEQLLEFINGKRDEKMCYEIISKLHKNSKLLNENMSNKSANQLVIDTYLRKNLITRGTLNMLIELNVINENNEII